MPRTGSADPIPTLALVLAALVAPTVVLAQSAVDRANALYAQISGENRSDRILLPPLARMEPPPPVVGSPTQAMLLPAGASGWEEAERWAKAAPQQEVIETVREVGGGWDPIRGKAFGLPYGVAAVAEMSEGLDLIEAGLYVELGEPPLLADARFLYLEALDDVTSLVNVEATRLAGEGDPEGAVSLLIDYLFFARQIATREMFVEARWGFRSMVNSLVRIRDVAYADWRSGSPALTGDAIRRALDRLDLDEDLRFDLINFPEGDRIAMNQVIGVIFDAGGRVDPNTFAPTMARLSSGERPLRLFSEIAWWREAAPLHADREETRTVAEGVWLDWAENRWRRDAFDPKLKTPAEFKKLGGRFAAVRAVYTRETPGGSVSPEELLHERQRAMTEAVGTRTALAIAGFHIAFGRFPPSVFAVRPRFLDRLDDDPFNDEPLVPLQYFVPWEANYRRSSSGEPTPPHQIRIILENGDNFLRRIGRDQFVVYSVGPNTADDRALNIDNSSRVNAGDYLIWPPVLSLHRQQLTEQGLFN